MEMAKVGEYELGPIWFRADDSGICLRTGSTLSPRKIGYLYRKSENDGECDAYADLFQASLKLLPAAEALLDKIAHVNGIESERAALMAACVKAHGGEA